MDIEVEPKLGGGQAKFASKGGDPSSPLLTVVTAVFNGLKDLESTIRSIIAQSGADMEYIVIDGGSKDGTLDVIRKYEDSIDYWVSEPDKGTYDAMNKGLKVARGKWIYYLNCGDTLAASDVLQRASVILKRTEAPIVAGFVRVDSPRTGNLRFPLPSTAGSSARGLFRSRFCHQALFVSRQAYLDQNGFDLSYPTFADFDVCWKIISTSGEFESIDLDIAHFDLNGISSDYRRSLQLYKEREKLFSKAREGRSHIIYWIGAAKALAYKYRRAFVDRFRWTS